MWLCYYRASVILKKIMAKNFSCAAKKQQNEFVKVFIRWNYIPNKSVLKINPMSIAYKTNNFLIIFYASPT